MNRLPQNTPSVPTGRVFLRLWLPAILWAGVITFLTSIPGEDLPPAPFNRCDLLVHGGIYGVLAFFLYRAFAQGARPRTVAVTWLLVFVLTQAYGIVDELHQKWIPGRTCDPVDALLDGIGGVAGPAAYLLWTWWRRRRRIT